MTGTQIGPGNPAPRLRLYCVPHAGGSATAFRNWPSGLPATIRVIPVEPPGRGARFGSPLPRRLADLVADLHDRILDDTGRDGSGTPVALFGHSMGAVVAYEAGRRLDSDGRPPAHVIVSGCAAPGSTGPTDPVHLLEDAELVDHLSRLGGAPAEVLADRELMALMLPIVRADLAALDGYVAPADPIPAFPMTAVGGSADPLVTRDALAAWSSFTSGPFRWSLLPAGHFYPDAVLPALFDRICRILLPTERTGRDPMTAATRPAATR